MTAAVREAMNTAPRLSKPLAIPAVLLSCYLLTSIAPKPFVVDTVGSPVRDSSVLRTLAAPVKRKELGPKVAIDFADVVGQLEATSQLSRSALASMIGVSRTTLYSWTQGKPVRGKNAQRTLALAAAVRKMVAFQNGGSLPALWQYQGLPSFGVSFVEGLQQGMDAKAMGDELVALWERDQQDGTVLAQLFDARD